MTTRSLLLTACKDLEHLAGVVFRRANLNVFGPLEEARLAMGMQPLIEQLHELLAGKPEPDQEGENDQ